MNFDGCMKGHCLVLSNIVNGCFVVFLYLVVVSLSLSVLQTSWIDFYCLVLGLQGFYNYLSIQLLYVVLKLCPVHFFLFYFLEFTTFV